MNHPEDIPSIHERLLVVVRAEPVPSLSGNSDRRSEKRLLAKDERSKTKEQQAGILEEYLEEELTGLISVKATE
jgi:hypothetical protein